MYGRAFGNPLIAGKSLLASSSQLLGRSVEIVQIDDHTRITVVSFNTRGRSRAVKATDVIDWESYRFAENDHSRPGPRSVKWPC